MIPIKLKSDDKKGPKWYNKNIIYGSATMLGASIGLRGWTWRALGGDRREVGHKQFYLNVMTSLVPSQPVRQLSLLSTGGPCTTVFTQLLGTTDHSRFGRDTTCACVGVVMTSYIIRHYEMTNRRPAFTKIWGASVPIRGREPWPTGHQHYYGPRRMKSNSQMSHTINYNSKTTHNFSRTAMARNNE